MERWKLTYELCTRFELPVTDHSFSLRCFPREMYTQRVQSCHYEVMPHTPSGRGTDSFGNPLLTGCHHAPHTSFLVRVEALVLTEQAPEPELREKHRLGMYRYFTAATAVGSCLEQFAAGFPPAAAAGPWDRAEEWMKILADRFYYQSESTGFDTTAEEAFLQGCGVCQDYAHILLALLRREGITARYVAGAVPGEGQTHAWVQVWQDGFWKGYDPTNARETDDSYLCLAVGRDAADCSLSRGIFKGGGGQEQFVYVRMRRE